MRHALLLPLAVFFSCHKPPPKPPPPPSPPAVIVELTAGSEFACARTDKGAVFCWGANEHGQIGNTLTATQPTPTRVANLAQAVQLAAGARHTCAILADKGALYCWGGNEHGQIGDGTSENRAQPTKILDPGPWAQVAAGGDITCGRKKDGSVLCWGEMQAGVSTKAPTAIPGLPPADEVSVGQAHVCARYNDGSVKCFGENLKRQLGVSKKVERNTPVDVPEIQAAQISLGREHSCARTPAGEIMCWGGGLECVPGQAQMGRIVAVKPAKVAGMENMITIASGGDGVCGIFASNGQVGCAKLDERNKGCTTENVATSQLYGVKVLAHGEFFACAVVKGGIEAYCWGAGRSGQLGDGKMEDHKQPELIKHPLENQEADVPPAPSDFVHE